MWREGGQLKLIRRRVDRLSMLARNEQLRLVRDFSNS